MAARAATMLAAGALVVVAAACMLAGGASAQSTSGCTQTLIGMSPCLNYITGNETAPSKSCCSQLASVVSSKPECLCVALNADPAALGLGVVNKTRALGLPDQCGVQTPPLSNCASAPTTSPSSGAPAGQTPTSSGAGSKSAPTTDVGNGVASLQSSAAGIVAGFVVAAVYALAAM
ncbi:non-specific lipid transfer protein GPI-anchored 2-like [Hordeum vulgare]|nr:non-specific lipid transfer protein GPI-anchored 2-like [Hordeum vulgare]